MVMYPCMCLRDRPFNLKGGGGGGGLWFSVSFRFFFPKTFKYLFFLSRKAQIFFPECNIRLYDKNSESDYFFFPPPKAEYFFRKNHKPPLYDFVLLNIV